MPIFTTIPLFLVGFIVFMIWVVGAAQVQVPMTQKSQDRHAFEYACNGTGALAVAAYLFKEGADEYGGYWNFTQALIYIEQHPDKMAWPVWVTVGAFGFLVLTGTAALVEGLRGPVKMARRAMQVAWDIVMVTICSLLLFGGVFLPKSLEKYWDWNNEANFLLHALYIFFLAHNLAGIYFWWDRKPKPPRPKDGGLFAGPGQGP